MEAKSSVYYLRYHATFRKSIRSSQLGKTNAFGRKGSYSIGKYFHYFTSDKASFFVYHISIDLLNNTLTLVAMSFFRSKSVNLPSLTKRLYAKRLQLKGKPVELQELIRPFCREEKWKEEKWEAFMYELLRMEHTEQERLFEKLNNALSSGEPIEPSRVMEYRHQLNVLKKTQPMLARVPENSLAVITYVHHLVQESGLFIQEANTAYNQAVTDLQAATETGRAAKEAADQYAWHLALSEADHSFRLMQQIQQTHKTTFTTAKENAWQILGKNSTNPSMVSGIYSLWNPLYPVQYLHLPPEKEKFLWEVQKAIQQAEDKLSSLRWDELDQEIAKWMDDLQSYVKLAQKYTGTHIK
jgi:hypothetical protein